MDQSQIEAKSQKEIKFTNIKDTVFQAIIKSACKINLNLYPKITFVSWVRTNSDPAFGFTMKVFPDKSYGTQHLYKFSWIDNGVELDPISKESCNSITGNEYITLLNHYKNESNK